MKVEDIYNLSEGLMALSDKELPVGIAYKIQRNQVKVAEEFKTAEKLRSKIIDKYKESDEEEGKVKLKKDKVDEFKKEFDELMAQKIDLKLTEIKLSELESISVKPRTLFLVSTILKEDE